MVHGNNVQAELLPWHFKANIDKTIFRCAVEPFAFEGSFVFWLSVSESLLAIFAEQSGLPESIILLIATFFLPPSSISDFLCSQQEDLARVAFVGWRFSVSLLSIAAVSLIGR